MLNHPGNGFTRCALALSLIYVILLDGCAPSSAVPVPGTASSPAAKVSPRPKAEYEIHDAHGWTVLVIQISIPTTSSKTTPWRFLMITSTGSPERSRPLHWIAFVTSRYGLNWTCTRRNACVITSQKTG